MNLEGWTLVWKPNARTNDRFGYHCGKSFY